MLFVKISFLSVVLISIIILLPATVNKLNWGYWTQFSQQADSFLNGHLDIPRQMDTVEYQGKSYWHQQPLPSLILIPFKLIWKNFDQFDMQIILIALVCLLLFKLSHKYKRSILDSLLLVAVFLCGSPVLGIILNPSSWYYAQLLTVVLMSSLLCEMETRHRALIMGILLSLIIATRPIASLIIIVIIFNFVKDSKKIIKDLTHLFLPIITTLLFLLFFNYIRFNNIFYNPYLTNQVGGAMGYFRSLGFVSIQHIPTNIYYYFLISVTPVTDSSAAHLIFPYITYSSWGISFFLITPFFLYAFRSILLTNLQIKLFWAVIFVNLVFLLLFFAPGWVQFGPRYTADFMPILFLLLLKTLPERLTDLQGIIIMISCFFNLYLYTTPFLLQI